MEITVNIKAPELAQSILALALAMGGQTTSAAAEIATTQEKPKRQQRATKSEEVKDTKPEEPQSQPDPIPEATDEDEKTPVPTVVELRAKAQEVGKTPEAKKAIKALLDQFGAKSISDVPEEKRAEFLEALDLV